MSILAESRVQDQKPYIEVKDVIVARSGIYRYTRAEVLARGHKPSRIKDFYDEFRPAAVIAAAAPLFDMVPVPNSEHVDVMITAENFRDQVSGMIGGPINVVPMPNGIDIGLQGRIAFFTPEAHEYYQAGNNETSADYISESVLVDNPEELGYDLLMTSISSVNNVAITKAGRGGKDVRIKDSGIGLGKVFDAIAGRKSMGMLTAFLKLDKGQEQKFSAVVKDSLLGMKGADAEKREELVESVMGRVSEISDSNMRSALQSVVRDSFTHPEEVLEHWKESEKIIDGIYARCQDADAAIVAEVTDAGSPGEKEEKGEKDGKKGGKEHEDAESADKEKKEEEAKKASAREKDSLVAIDGKLDAFRTEIAGLIKEGIKEALGVEGDGHGPVEHRALDSVAGIDLGSEDASFAIEGAFGSPRA